MKGAGYVETGGIGGAGDALWVGVQRRVRLAGRGSEWRAEGGNRVVCVSGAGGAGVSCVCSLVVAAGTFWHRCCESHLPLGQCLGVGSLLERKEPEVR